MAAKQLHNGGRYRLADGREFIVLSFNFTSNCYRITWTKPEHRHEDVFPHTVECAQLVERLGGEQ